VPALEAPQSAADLLMVLFKRKPTQTSNHLRDGEAVAHPHTLGTEGKLTRLHRRAQGVFLVSAA
jgi:hypothetical protein